MSLRLHIMKKIAVCLLLLSICFPLSAQNRAALPEDLWISPGADIAFYSPVSLSFGGGMAIAYGNGTSIGIKALWLFDNDSQLSIMELCFLFRLYLFGSFANSGLFIQLEGGPAIYFEREEKISLPVKIGTLTAGLTLGWRFLFGKYFFVEPSMRGGYPYIAGAGLSAGVRF